MTTGFGVPFALTFAGAAIAPVAVATATQQTTVRVNPRRDMEKGLLMQNVSDVKRGQNETKGCGFSIAFRPIKLILPDYCYSAAIPSVMSLSPSSLSLR